MDRLNQILPAVLGLLVGLLWLAMRLRNASGCPAPFGLFIVLTFWGMFCLMTGSLLERALVDFLIEHATMGYPVQYLYSGICNLCALAVASFIVARILREKLSIGFLDWFIALCCAAFVPQLVQLALVFTPLGRQLVWWP
jgi:hypothetical protein